MDDMETRVWQRVLNQPEQPRGEDVKPLILAAQEAAAVYGALGVKELQETQKKILACLKGISGLQGQTVALNPMHAPKEPRQKALEKSYYRSRKAMMEYMVRSAGTEFGEIFRELAEWERRQGIRIVQILGSMK